MQFQILATEYNEALVNKLATLALKNDPTLDNMRCIFQLNDSDIIHLLTIDEFMSLDPAYDSLKKFKLGQMVNI